MCINSIKGDKLIIGDEDGKVYVLKLSKSFYSKHDDEMKKEYINKLFERELTREKYIDAQNKKKGGQVKDETSKITKQEQIIKDKIRRIDEEYSNFLSGMLNKSFVQKE